MLTINELGESRPKRPGGGFRNLNLHWVSNRRSECERRPARMPTRTVFDGRLDARNLGYSASLPL